MSQIRIAQQLDPLSLIINANAGFSLYYARRYDEAIQELQKTIELDPEFALPYQILGYIYGVRGERNKSISTLQKAVLLSPQNVSFQADLAWAYAAAGQKGKAQETLNELLRVSSLTYVPPFHVAAVYSGLHQNEDALKWLDRAYEDRSDQITYIAMDPRFDPIRNEPHFRELIKKVGLSGRNQ